MPDTAFRCRIALGMLEELRTTTRSQVFQMSRVKAELMPTAQAKKASFGTTRTVLVRTALRTASHSNDLFSFLFFRPHRAGQLDPPDRASRIDWPFCLTKSRC